MPTEPVTHSLSNKDTKPISTTKTKPSQTSSEKSLPKLDYIKPEWSSQPPEATGDSEQDEEGFCNHYYLEVGFSFYLSCALTQNVSNFSVNLNLCGILVKLSFKLSYKTHLI